MSLGTVREVVDALGGLKAVADLTGVDPGTVSAWQTRIGSFPARTYLVLTAALEERGKTAPAGLWRMAEARAL